MKITKDDISNFKKSILTILNNNNIKYKIDTSIIPKIRYDILCEKFPKDRVDKLIKEKKKKIEDLNDDTFFESIKNNLINFGE